MALNMNPAAPKVNPPRRSAGTELQSRQKNSGPKKPDNHVSASFQLELSLLRFNPVI
jgi:hypothetical protein